MVNLGWCLMDSDFTREFSRYVHGAITISLQTSRWAELKVKAQQLVFPSIILSWIVNMLVN
ncbi:hypothetical protein Celaphus_00004815, partial [Cervus elaphus hippelaphus]